jgi:hypothetical protein
MADEWHAFCCRTTPDIGALPDDGKDGERSITEHHPFMVFCQIMGKMVTETKQNTIRSWYFARLWERWR